MSNPMLTRSAVEAIRNKQVTLPAGEVDPHVIEACGLYLTAGEALPVESARQRTWSALQSRLRFLERRSAIRIRLAYVTFIVLAMLLLATIGYALGWFAWLQSILWGEEQMNITLVPESVGSSVEWVISLDEGFLHALNDQDMSPPLPMRVPPGYVFTSVSAKRITSTWDQVTAIYTSGEATLFIQVDRHINNDGEIISSAETNAGAGETYTLGSATVAVYENLSNVGATLTSAPYVVEIFGSGLTHDDIYFMLDKGGYLI